MADAGKGNASRRNSEESGDDGQSGDDANGDKGIDKRYQVANVDLSYPMSGTKRGRFIIINMTEFPECYSRRERKNSMDDVEQLTKVMNKLHFDVIRCINRTAKQIRDEVATYANDNDYNHDADCIGVAIMSHGLENDSIFTADVPLSVKEIMKLFKSSEKNRSLHGKPKFFILQYCRGGKRQFGLTIKNNTDAKSTQTDGPDTYLVDPEVEPVKKSPPDGDWQEESNNDTDSNVTIIPVQCDMICAYATSEGCTARLSQGGAPFIQTLCLTLEKHAMNLDFERILTRVSHSVNCLDFTVDDKKVKQSPTIVSTLTKDFFLRPNVVSVGTQASSTDT